MIEITLPELSRKLGCNYATARKWLNAEGVKPVRVEGRESGKGSFHYYDEEKATAAVKPHLKAQHNTVPSIDPETGLTWGQKKTMEEALKLEREREIADALKAKELMRVSDHQRILTGGISRLEQVPGKAQSELGLSGQQVLGLQRMLDEVRSSWAKDVGQMANANGE